MRIWALVPGATDPVASILMLVTSTAGRQPSEGASTRAIPLAVIAPTLTSVWQSVPAGNRAGSMFPRLALTVTPSQRASPKAGHAADTLGSSPATSARGVRSKNWACAVPARAPIPKIVAMTLIPTIFQDELLISFSLLRVVRDAKPHVTWRSAAMAMPCCMRSRSHRRTMDRLAAPTAPAANVSPAGAFPSQGPAQMLLIAPADPHPRQLRSCRRVCEKYRGGRAFLGVVSHDLSPLRDLTDHRRLPDRQEAGGDGVSGNSRGSGPSRE